MEMIFIAKEDPPLDHILDEDLSLDHIPDGQPPLAHARVRGQRLDLARSDPDVELKAHTEMG